MKKAPPARPADQLTAAWKGLTTLEALAVTAAAWEAAPLYHEAARQLEDAYAKYHPDSQEVCQAIEAVIKVRTDFLAVIEDLKKDPPRRLGDKWTSRRSDPAMKKAGGDGHRGR